MIFVHAGVRSVMIPGWGHLDTDAPQLEATQKVAGELYPDVPTRTNPD